MTAKGLLFDVLFPEHGERGLFRNNLSASANHCIMRAMQHLSGNDTGNTYPSTKDGELLPFNPNVDC